MEKRPITPVECRDTALAVTFLILLIWLFTGHKVLVYAAMAFLLYAMLLPQTLVLPARVWFGFSHLLGQVMSRILLGIIFVLIVMPVAVFRKVLGKDSLSLRSWKKSEASAFVVRDHSYGKDDLTNQF